MNPIAEEILMHYGMPRRSGRYPWGSGENPYQHSGDFLSRVDELKSQGMSDTEIAKRQNISRSGVFQNRHNSLELMKKILKEK